MTLPTIPDNFYKLLIVCGLASLIYSYITFDKTNKDFKEKANLVIGLSDSISVNTKILDHYSEQLLNFTKYLSEKEGVDSIYLSDSTDLYLNQKAIDKIRDQSLKDSAIYLYKIFHDENFFKIKLLLYKWSERKKNLSDEFEELKDNLDTLNIFLNVGYLLLTIGLIGFIRQQILNDKLLLQQVKEKRANTFCQSCGKSFSAVRKKGTEANGLTNDYFCNDCYENGQFTNQGLTLQNILKTTKESTEYKKSNWFTKIQIVNRILNLDRWNPDKY